MEQSIMNTEDISFGKILKYYGTKLSLTQEELADGICSRKYISRLEKDIQVPTLDTVNKLFNKLEINIYDTYALMLRHHDIETHIMIENLNDNFSHACLKNLKPLIDNYSLLVTFKTGEPFLILAYAQNIPSVLVTFQKEFYREQVSHFLYYLFLIFHKFPFV